MQWFATPGCDVNVVPIPDYRSEAFGTDTNAFSPLDIDSVKIFFQVVAELV